MSNSQSTTNNVTPRGRSSKKRNQRNSNEDSDPTSSIQPLTLDQIDPHSGLRKATFDNPQTNRYIKKMKWAKFPDSTLKQVRNILSNNYQATLRDVPGLTESNQEINVEAPLRSIAKSINSTLKNTLVPGDLKDNILDARNDHTKDNLNEKQKFFKRESAIKELRREKYISEMSQKSDELKYLEQKLLDVKNKLISHPIKETRKLDAYTHSLLADPSSAVFNPPK